jgi:hypothetical protein
VWGVFGGDLGMGTSCVVVKGGTRLLSRRIDLIVLFGGGGAPLVAMKSSNRCCASTLLSRFSEWVR